jgi:hypothetical protein
MVTLRIMLPTPSSVAEYSTKKSLEVEPCLIYMFLPCFAFFFTV